MLDAQRWHAPTLTINLIYMQAVLVASAWQEVQKVIKTKRRIAALLRSSSYRLIYALLHRKIYPYSF